MNTHNMSKSFTSVLMIAVCAHGQGLAASATPTESTVPGIVSRVLSENKAGTLWSYWPLPCVSLDGSVFVDTISTPKGTRWRVNGKMTDLSGIALGFVGEANEPVMVKALPVVNFRGVAPITCGQKRVVQGARPATAKPLIEVAGSVVTVRCDTPASVLANDWAVVLQHRNKYYYNGKPLDCAGVSGATFALASGAPGYACVAKGQERDTVYLNDQKLSSHFAVYGLRLSDNGKHVAYAADDGDTWGVFLDGKKVCDLDKSSVGGVRVLAVSGNGQRALYTAQKSVYLNGTKVAEGDGTKGALGDDGKSWAVVTSSALILNGNVASRIPYSEARLTDTGKLIAWRRGALFFEGRDYRIGRSITSRPPMMFIPCWSCVDNTYWDGKRLRISWVEFVDNKLISYAVDTSAMRPSADLKKDNEPAIVFDEEAGPTGTGDARKDTGDAGKDTTSPKGDVLDKAGDAATKVEDVKRRIDNIRDRLRF